MGCTGKVHGHTLYLTQSNPAQLSQLWPVCGNLICPPDCSLWEVTVPNELVFFPPWDSENEGSSDLKLRYDWWSKENRLSGHEVLSHPGQTTFKSSYELISRSLVGSLLIYIYSSYTYCLCSTNHDWTAQLALTQLSYIRLRGVTLNWGTSWVGSGSAFSQQVCGWVVARASLPPERQCMSPSTLC